VLDSVVVELKAIERVLPIHQAIVLSYLRATGLRLGLLLNFHRPTLGIQRILNPKAPSVAP
jgi:GxxExxY protein